MPPNQSPEPTPICAFSPQSRLTRLAAWLSFDRWPPMKTRRFIISSICAMLVVLGLFLWLVLGFPDHMNPTDPPPTVGREILRFVCMIACWPFAITSLILHGDPPLLIYWLLLWVATGAFWAFIIELFIILRSRGSIKSPEPTAVGAAVPQSPRRESAVAQLFSPLERL